MEIQRKTDEKVDKDEKQRTWNDPGKTSANQHGMIHNCPNKRHLITY